tara:strand:- start:810 stop:1022 length:213 start_codon:yes stop_codon:yes gene_type:complete
MIKQISIEENAARNEYQETLYRLDNRDDPKHPKTGTFSGLHQEILTYERLKKELAIYEKWKNRYWRIAND